MKIKNLLPAFALFLVLSMVLPMYIVFGYEGQYDDNNAPGTSAITGSFTLPNPTRDVTIELWYNSGNDYLKDAAVMPITHENRDVPVYFSFGNLPAGTYRLIFSKPGHTSFTVNGIVVTGEGDNNLDLRRSFPDLLPLRPGDVTGSGQVNIAGLGILLQNWAGDYVNADFTNSGQINISDLNLMLQNWMAESASISVLPRYIPFEYTRSDIQLPNAMLTEDERAAWIEEYYRNGGASAFELQMIYHVNLVRETYGLSPLTIDPTLMHAARFYAQTLGNHDLVLSSTVGPYGGSRQTATAFGARLVWSGGSSNWGGWSYTAVLARWMSAAGHRNFILSPNHIYIGFGSHLGGRHGVFHYLFLNNPYPQEPSEQSELMGIGIVE